MGSDGVYIKLLGNAFGGDDPLVGGYENLVQKDLLQTGAAVFGQDTVSIVNVLGKKRITLFHDPVHLDEEIPD